MTVDEIKERIRDVADFPRPGIVFKDITPLLADGAAFRAAVTLMAERLAAWRPQVLVGIESRGFIIGAALAHHLGLGLVPVRKPGKLPWKTHQVEYQLEYGSDALEMHHDAFVAGARVAVVDDLLATGGTAAATTRLIERVGGQVVGCAFLVELTFLEGRERLTPVPVDALIAY